MRIEKYANTDKQDVENKKFNIWIGISLGNKYFIKNNIKEYIEWAVKHTKNNVLVVVADLIYAINLEVFDKKSKDSSISRAVKIGNIKKEEVQDIIRQFPVKISNKIKVVSWKDVTDSNEYKEKLGIIKQEFKDNKKFHDYIIDIVREGRPDRKTSFNKLTNNKKDRLAEYVLEELPLFVDGVRTKEGTLYTLIPYPGFSKLDELFIGIQNKTLFCELSEKLDLNNKIQILEAYVD